MKTAYTPAPWHSSIEDRGILLAVVVRNDEGDMICESAPKPTEPVHVRKENGFLIAAAPELHEALADLMAMLEARPKLCGHFLHCLCPIDRARDVLAKLNSDATKKKIDRHGVHLHGCECSECTKTNTVCPACGREYWTDLDRPDMNECPRCMWHPEVTQ